ncbi:DgyrCDS13673 [Dimorphilus gyrociliatus]|uniref:DgyrCDS13673 n=1 Tax=Dimorphilus gyrociliatus TaxID=2664684 RepID=A0A7I8WBD5_9ANNE|nr:DgyrCDS13673 [Dimorphilus gyrociliatus]
MKRKVCHILFLAFLCSIWHRTQSLSRVDKIRNETEHFVKIVYEWLDNDDKQQRSKDEIVDALNSYLLFDFTIERERFKNCIFNIINSDNRIQLIRKLDNCTNLNIRNNPQKALTISRNLNLAYSTLYRLSKNEKYSDIKEIIETIMRNEQYFIIDNCRRNDTVLYKKVSSFLDIVYLYLRSIYPEVKRLFKGKIRLFSFAVCFITETENLDDANDIIRELFHHISYDKLIDFEDKILRIIKDEKFYKQSISIVKEFIDFIVNNNYLGIDSNMKNFDQPLEDFLQSLVEKYGSDFLKYFDLLDGYGLKYIQVDKTSISTIVDYLKKLGYWRRLCKYGKCPGETDIDKTIARYIVAEFGDSAFHFIETVHKDLAEVLNSLRDSNFIDIFKQLDLIHGSE